MPIGALIQNAYLLSPDFIAQVNSTLVKWALYQRDTITDLSDNSLNYIAAVVKGPQNYYFPQAIVAKSTWDIGFDAWAADPSAQDANIEAHIKNLWPLLVGTLTHQDGSPVVFP